MTVTYAVHMQLPHRKQIPSETAEQTEVHLPGDRLRHECCRASATQEHRVHLAADRLRRQRWRAEEMVQHHSSRLKCLRSTQVQHLAAETEEQRAARLQQLIAIQKSRDSYNVYMLKLGNTIAHQMMPFSARCDSSPTTAHNIYCYF